jgi:predicted nucleotidyltransferase
MQPRTPANRGSNGPRRTAASHGLCYDELVNRDAILRAVEAELTQSPGDVIAAWLYGSVARSGQRPTSDVDVALLYRSDPPHVLDSPPRRFEEKLERALGIPVEVVVMNGAPADLIHRVLRDGILLADRDRSARIQFEVRSRNEYFDLLPILDRYRRAHRRSG